jgi:hypothetical protein
MGRVRAAKIPARKIAIRKDRIMERKTAEIKTTSKTTTKLFNRSLLLFMTVSLPSGWRRMETAGKHRPYDWIGKRSYPKKPGRTNPSWRWPDHHMNRLLTGIRFLVKGNRCPS